jgi:hypothetical protein
MYFFISPHSQLLLDMVFKSIWEMLFHKLHDMWKSKFHMPTCRRTANEWVVIYNENRNELPKLMIHDLKKTTSLWWYKQRPYTLVVTSLQTKSELKHPHSYEKD